jgi:predicted metal-binding protein
MGTANSLETLFTEHNYTDFKWLDPKEIVVAQWVRMKCMFGCGEYGHNASCPPNVPSVSECSRFFSEYETAAVFHFPKTVDKPEDRHKWSRKVNRGLIKLERAVFRAGYQKTFLLCMDSCGLCKECTGVREECIEPRSARPSPEAMGVDVFATMRKIDYPIAVLPDYHDTMNRYAILLIE